MASKKFEKGSEEWQFFNDYYKFRQQFYEADNEDAFFEELAKQANKLYEKYKKTEIAEYAKRLIMAHLDDVDRRCRKGR